MMIRASLDAASWAVQSARGTTARAHVPGTLIIPKAWKPRALSVFPQYSVESLESLSFLSVLN